MPKLFIIAGHGAGDPGACGNGYTEAERVRALAQRIKILGGDNVLLGDVSRDYYADNGISTLDIPADYQITELHMDAGRETAQGGHVLIKDGFEPDEYDNALADMLGEILPGRSSLIVARGDLANMDRAAARGYGYRLVEFGFITNAEDVKIFNSRMGDIARGVLEAFEITPVGNTTSKNSNTEGDKEEMKEIWAVEGIATQYLFDGCHLHGFTSQKEKDLFVEAYERVTGKKIGTHRYSQADFKQLRALLNRIG